MDILYFCVEFAFKTLGGIWFAVELVRFVQGRRG